jgi:hypothetical protein
MAAIPLSRPPVNPSANPTMTTAGATDTIDVPPTGKILLLIQNTTGTIDNVVVDDPSSQNPGAATQFNPDVSFSVAATTGVRHCELDCQRFRNANGQISLTHSQSGAGVSSVAYGPYNA